MAENTTYTEDEVTTALNMQELRLGLKTVTTTLTALQSLVQSSAKNGEDEFRKVLDEIRSEELKRVVDKNDIREEVFEKFLQKKDLKTYLAIIMVVVSLTTGGIQWIMGTITAKATDIKMEANKDKVIKELVKTLENHKVTSEN